jgi:hypothetical protein
MHFPPAAPTPAAPPPAAPSRDAPPPPEPWPVLRASPGWGADVNAFAGLAMPARSDTQSAHGLVGGLARVRWSYLQLGGSYEVTDDLSEGRWRSIGGFAGVWLPFRDWLDLEAATGLAWRTHSSAETRYGPDGYEVSSPALTLRVGASGRTSESRYAARVGGALFAAMDLSPETVPWTFEHGPLTDRRTITGEQPVGGFTFGLLLAVGFDVDLDRRTAVP